MTKNIYQFDMKSIAKLQNDRKKEIRSDLDTTSSSKESQISLRKRGYTVNSNNKDFLHSNTQSISFFSGAGGLDIGAQLAGCKVISSLDFDRDSIETLKLNNYFKSADHILGDISNVSGRDYKKIIKAQNPEKLILIGGPPCQPFSKAGYWVTHKNRLGSEDPRNMIGQYLRLIAELKPNGFLLENVESLLHPKNKDAVNALEEAIDKMGYKFIKYRADATNFGVPQKRKRVFFLASKKSFRGEPVITHSTYSATTESQSLLPCERVIDWIAKFDINIYQEREESTSGKTYDIELKEVPPGSNYFALTERDGYPNPKFEANKRFWSFLLKLHPLEPSWTISAQPGPWVGPFHWNNRRLRVPEIAAIQTFPDDYMFAGSRRSIQKQIGNAVPPLLAKSMVEFLISKL
ncbi:MAG: DNA cytosine methyltransferase [Polynucleobacter sp.]|nr:DNA cytosine methyltransferase [Polynucleobacter sp.]